MKLKFLILTIFLTCASWWVGKVFSNPPLIPCDFFALKMDVPLQIQEAITMDKGQNPLLTRFFHNKPLFYGVNFTQCYFKYFHPYFLILLLHIFGFIFFLPGIYFLLENWRRLMAKILLFSLFITPLLNIFISPTKRGGVILLAVILWVVSFYGLWSLSKLRYKTRGGCHG